MFSMRVNVLLAIISCVAARTTPGKRASKLSKILESASVPGDEEKLQLTSTLLINNGVECSVNEYVSKKGKCKPCKALTYNEAGDLIAAGRSYCDANIITAVLDRTFISGSQDGSSNYPAPRHGACTWVDQVDGTLWMFGGSAEYGKHIDDPTAQRWLNEVWFYNISTTTWTRFGDWYTPAGNSDCGASTDGTLLTNYGADVSLSDCKANCEAEAGCQDITHTTADFTCKTFSVCGTDPADDVGIQRMSFRHGANRAGNYPAYGTSSLSAWPGARERCQTASLSNGTVFLYGGVGVDWSGSVPERSQPVLSDQWMFDPRATDGHYWTWTGGSKARFGSGRYCERGFEGAICSPGARHSGAIHLDSNEKIWLIGGYGYGAYHTDARLNDVWRLDPTVNHWMWVAGKDEVVDFGTWGIRGVPEATNNISSRYGSYSWVGSDGTTIYMKAGYGDYEQFVPNLAGTGFLSDIWSFDTTTSEWTWQGGPVNSKQLGTTIKYEHGLSRCNFQGPMRDGSVFVHGDVAITMFGFGKGMDKTNDFQNGAFYNDVDSDGVPQWHVGGNLNGYKVGGSTNIEGGGIQYPQARAGAQSWDVGNGVMFVFGGESGNYSIINDFWKFELNTAAQVPAETTCPFTPTEKTENRLQFNESYPFEPTEEPFPKFVDNDNFATESKNGVPLIEEQYIGGDAGYSFRTSGSCNIQVRDITECTAAAVSMGLTDQTATDDGRSASSGHPRYCYYDSVNDELWFNNQFNETSNSADCTTDFQCICNTGDQFPVFTWEIESNPNYGTGWNESNTTGGDCYYESITEKQGEASAGKAKRYAIQEGILEYVINVRTPTKQKADAGQWILLCYAMQSNAKYGNDWNDLYWFSIEEANNLSPHGATYTHPWYHGIITKGGERDLDDVDSWSWDSWVTTQEFDYWESVALSLGTGKNNIYIAPNKPGVRIDKCALYLDGFERALGVVNRDEYSRFAQVVDHLQSSISGELGAGNPTNYPVDGWDSLHLSDTELTFEGRDQTIFEQYGGSTCSPLLVFELGDCNKSPNWGCTEDVNGSNTAHQAILADGSGRIEMAFYTSTALTGYEKWSLACLSRQNPNGAPLEGYRFDFKLGSDRHRFSSSIDAEWWTSYTTQNDWKWTNVKTGQLETSAYLTLPHGANYLRLRPSPNFDDPTQGTGVGTVISKCLIFAHAEDWDSAVDRKLTDDDPYVADLLAAVESGATFDAIQDCITDRDKDLLFPEGLCDTSEFHLPCNAIETTVNGSIVIVDECDQCPPLEKYCCKCADSSLIGDAICPIEFFDPDYEEPEDYQVIEFPNSNYTAVCGSASNRLEFLAKCTAMYDPLTCTECRPELENLKITFIGPDDFKDILANFSDAGFTNITLDDGTLADLSFGDSVTSYPSSYQFPLPSPAVPSSLSDQKIPSGVVKDDPHFSGFDGSTFEFQGVPGQIFNLISDVSVQVNAKFIDSHWDKKTFINKMGISIMASRIIINLDSVKVDGKKIELGQGVRISNAGTVLMRRHPKDGLLYTTVKALGFHFLISTKKRKSDGLLFLNLNTLSAKNFVNPHGVLGQTARYIVEGTKPHPINLGHRSLNGEGFIEGDMADYRVHNGINGDFFTFNRFVQLEPEPVTVYHKSLTGGSIAEE